ncbi:major facilitator superfamily domain-containing protein [Zychaea mexicana]|uniref:major facilitator superfamily domain-containing protein n=1 Tax=Zychaea mexicana TaxID=64656 RepID=UPI0022FED523|nr:major facilitator superfamily domain-containing protein [Zychaea mexicana]KAI9489625.1 major facilitator superfamily domain-containing protein [Zychaea mexicana]
MKETMYGSSHQPTPSSDDMKRKRSGLSLNRGNTPTSMNIFKATSEKKATHTSKEVLIDVSTGMSLPYSSNDPPPPSPSSSATTTMDDVPKNKKDQTENMRAGGHYGWLVVLGSSLASFTVFGTMMSWGVMQNYCVHHLFGDSSQNRTLVSFAGTLCYFVSDVFTPFACMLESLIGTQPALLLGTFLVSGGLVASGSATEIWHLYLSHGICFGLGSSIMYIVTMTITTEWFQRGGRMSTVNGIVTSSIGLAGLITPMIMTASNSKLGVHWTFRILGLTFFGANLITTLLVKQKDPKMHRAVKHMGDVIQWDLLKNTNLQIWILSAFLQVLCIFVPYFFLPSYATFLGLSTAQGSSLVSVTAATSCIGRISVGLFADRVGNLNASIVFSLIGGLTSLLIWTFAYDYSMLLIYAVAFGFFGGAYYTILAPTLRFILGAEQFHSGFSLLMVLTSPAIVGPTLASTIESISPWEPFLSYKIFCGIVSITSCIVTLYLKLKLNPEILAKL